MIRIIGLDVIEEELLGSALFEFVALGYLSKGFVRCFFLHTEELTCFHPFISSDVSIMIEIEHVERCIDALSQLRQQLRM